MVKQSSSKKTTSNKVAGEASKTLKDKHASKNAKSIAGSALAQAKTHKK
ncbi:hypothetical protein [Bombilactobacillus mellis]|nr:hypothetical protein [Bombilactobacillus mellis]